MLLVQSSYPLLRLQLSLPLPHPPSLQTPPASREPKNITGLVKDSQTRGKAQYRGYCQTKRFDHVVRLIVQYIATKDNRDNSGDTIKWWGEKEKYPS